MAWNNGFPVTYGYPQGYPQPYQQLTYQQPSYQQNGTAQQTLTPPTIRAEIVQVEDETAASNFPVGAGASQMMISRDESAIFIKSAMANGQTTLNVYERRAPKPPVPVFDPGEYVRKDELEKLVNEAISAQIAITEKTAPVRRAVKKEDV